MKIAACNLSLVPLRAQPSHKSEMVSQVLFGERFEIIDEDIDFVKARLIDVDYEGWIQRNQYDMIDYPSNDTSLIVGLKGARAMASDSQINLIHGTSLVNPELIIGNKRYTVEGDLRRPMLSDFNKEFELVKDYYLHSPYLWGGRSVYGIDCSGFSQVVYKHFGINLPRDAWQQAEVGEVVDFLSEIRKGDLAFFDNEVSRITHVGVMIDHETIIHASGRVRVDKMDNEGIFNAELNKYTHRLRIVKRYF